LADVRNANYGLDNHDLGRLAQPACTSEPTCRVDRSARCRSGGLGANLLSSVCSATSRLTRRRSWRGPASVRRPSRLVKIKTRRRRAACIARLTCVHAVRRVGFGTRALAAQLSVWAVRPATFAQPHISPAQPRFDSKVSLTEVNGTCACVALGGG